MTNEITVTDVLFAIERNLNEGDELMAELGVMALLEMIKETV